VTIQKCSMYELKLIYVAGHHSQPLMSCHFEPCFMVLVMVLMLLQ